MKRVGSLLVLVAVLGLVIPGAVVARKKPRLGVFGTINEKRFNATNLNRADDPCVNGIYKPNVGIITLVAGECRAKRRRQGTAFKKNYKILVIGCTNFDETVNTLAPPYEIPCALSIYQETRTGRFGIPRSMTWGANVDFTNPLLPTSNLRMRIDSFDGTSVRGVIFGVFEVPVTPDAAPPAPISGEVQFNFPFKVQ